MKRISGLIALIFLAIFAMYAGNEPVKAKTLNGKCSITGTITDKITGEPLAGVELMLIDSETKIYSDLDGKFEIKDVSPGMHSILLNFISYKEQVENVETEKGNSTTVTIELNSVEK